MGVKTVQSVTDPHLPKPLSPMPPKFVKSSSVLIQKVQNSPLLHFQIALERHYAHHEIDDLPNHLPSIFCKIFTCPILQIDHNPRILFVNVLILEWNKNMDEDHNQEAGFVTEEVNQVVKVIIQIQTFYVQVQTSFSGCNRNCHWWIPIWKQKNRCLDEFCNWTLHWESNKIGQAIQSKIKPLVPNQRNNDF